MIIGGENKKKSSEAQINKKKKLTMVDLYLCLNLDNLQTNIPALVGTAFTNFSLWLFSMIT